ncbi:MAG: citramalate synthase [bacterium]
MKKIFLYDTTLRDGSQGEEVSFSVEDKLRVAQHLDAFGMDYVEGGWPGSNPRDLEFFRLAKEVHFHHAKLAAFGSTRRANCSASADPNLNQLLEANTPVVTIFGKSWLMHVHEALQISRNENLSMINESVALLKASGREVIYDAEHFFDGFKDDASYALETIVAAESAGADVIVLCDTNGGTLPHEVEVILSKVRQTLHTPIGIHAHNDSELAVANSLSAVNAGAIHVQGTINGFGERVGNANLCSVIPNLQIKLGYHCVDTDQLSALTSLSHFVSECANHAHSKNLPFVGQSAFAHKGGVHVSAVMKLPQTYEHLNPELVGNKRRVLVSDLSGKSNIVYKAEELGIDLSQQSSNIKQLVDEIKDREYRGYRYEDADGSLELLIRKSTEDWEDFFELEGFKVIIHKESMDAQPKSEALIKVRVGDEVEYTAAEGNGPVNALDNALRKALDKFYPELRQIYLADYKVRVLDGQDGTSAKVRVLITNRTNHLAWNTVGVSTDIIEASWIALVEGLSYHLMKTQTELIREVTDGK